MSPECLDNPNFESSRFVWHNPNDGKPTRDHSPAMSETGPDWYLKDWLSHFKKRQAALVNELGWDKAKANFVFHGKQPYRRDLVNQVSEWLGIEPYELLMPPLEALALRALREHARVIAAEAPVAIAADKGRPFAHAPKSG